MVNTASCWLTALDRAVCTGTAPATAPTRGATAAASYVNNPYFPFPYAPASFANSASCAAATKACSDNYSACLTGLQGVAGGYRVTINVPGGGGTTIGGAAGNLGSSATPICSSLSSRACSKLDATDCDFYGQGSNDGNTRLPPPALLMLAATLGIFLSLPAG